MSTDISLHTFHFNVDRMLIASLQLPMHSAFGSFFNLVSIFLKWYSLYYYHQCYWKYDGDFVSWRSDEWNYIVYTMWLCRCWLCVFFLPTWIIIMASLKLKLMQHFRFPGANRKRCWENNFNIRTKCAIPNVYNLKWC